MTNLKEIEPIRNEVGRSPRPLDAVVSLYGKRNCYCCAYAKFEYYMDDIDWDVTGCKKWGLYDDDARFEGKCGEEGKDYIDKTKFDWLRYDIKRWIKMIYGTMEHLAHYGNWWWKPLRNSNKQLKQRAVSN
jgi:hypothetical protein